MNARFLGTNLDLVVILVYFVAVLGFGLCFARYTATTKDFFFGGQRFSWWLIAFSCIATTVGSYSFVKYSEAGFRYGISSTQTYLNDWFWMPLLILVWIPIIYFRRIQTIPEYMERRFDAKTRVAATCIILLYIIGYIGINLITLGRVLEELLGWDVFWGAAATAAAVALYVFIGGQTSIIMTDLAQGVILLLAGLGLLAVGIVHFGGFADFWALLPREHKFAFSDFDAPAQFSFIGIYVQDGLANTGALMLMHQGFIMRFLSLKSVKDARKMAVCWILVLAPLAAVATSGAGWLAKALVVKGDLPEIGPEDAFVQAAHFLCAPGVYGFVLAALTAALMSTADTLINAVSALFVNDIWRPYIHRKGSDRQHLLVARITSLCAAALGLALVPIYMHDTIYGAHAMFTAAVTPPLVVAIFLAILWQRYTPAAAFVTVTGGSVLIALSFAWPDALVGPFDFGMGEGSYKFMRSLFGLTVCGALGIGVTCFTRPKPLSEIRGMVAGTQLDAARDFKGGEPNTRPGGKARLRVKIDKTLAETDLAVLPKSALDEMAADPGDLLYASHPSWWYGGLRSVHLRAGEPGQEWLLRIGPESAKTAHLSDEQEATVEKIM
ncbi:MAG TPA: sodium:solute symporter family protein [Sumerlaeia bacterium]|nr:sodium:solute symporter family protein [Sumerlaeia bacterium]